MIAPIMLKNIYAFIFAYLFTKSFDYIGEVLGTIYILCNLII